MIAQEKDEGIEIVRCKGEKGDLGFKIRNFKIKFGKEVEGKASLSWL